MVAIYSYIPFKNKKLPMCSTALCSYIIIIMTINRPVKNSFTSFKRANDGLSRPHSVILLFVDIIIRGVASVHLQNAGSFRIIIIPLFFRIYGNA